MARSMKQAGRGAQKWHVVDEQREAQVLPAGRCGAVLVPGRMPAHDVPTDERCRASACAAAWPAYLRLIESA